MGGQAAAVAGSACVTSIGGIVLLVIALVLVRKALPLAGFLLAGAGALELLGSCCTGFTATYPAAVGVDSFYEVVSDVSSPIQLLLSLATYGLIIGAGAALARAAVAQRPKTAAPTPAPPPPLPGGAP